jgi:hypothetical protein
MSKRRALIGLLVAGVAAAGFSVAGGAAAQASVSNPIRIAGSSHCLDNATENAAKLQMWSCTGGNEQNWTDDYDSANNAYRFRNLRSGLCIVGVPRGTGTVGMSLCSTNILAEEWRPVVSGDLGGSNGSYNIWVNASSGACLSTPSVGNGTLVQTTTCDFYSDPYYRWHG